MMIMMKKTFKICSLCLMLMFSLITLTLQSDNSTTSSTSTSTSTSTSSSTMKLAQITDKLISKLKTHLLTLHHLPSINEKTSRSYGYDYGYGFLDGYPGHDIWGKSDYSWIVPLIIVIGFGTLLIPLLGTLMTTMMTQGTINLTAGRRRKRSVLDDLMKNTKLAEVMKTLEKSLERFSAN